MVWGALMKELWFNSGKVYSPRSLHSALRELPARDELGRAVVEGEAVAWDHGADRFAAQQAVALDERAGLRLRLVRLHEGGRPARVVEA